MEVVYLVALTAALSRSAAEGRPVNISTAWFLPEEGFPVFYRFFDEKLTWNEAQAVCGSHHADLLSVQTPAEMDAAKAYLKEIDVADNVWIGLRDSPEEPFSWTNGEKLLGEGYWLEPVPKSSERLCAAIDPAADFRWKSYFCGGPQVGPFVCQTAVPEWAKQCLVKSLPSLTVTLLPEAGVVQLLSDCGLDGTRRIACNEKADREQIIKRLSCDVDAFASTVFARSTTADALRDTNTQVSWSDITNQPNRHHTTNSYRPLTRHRRSAPPTPHTASPPPPPLTLSPNDTAPVYKLLPVLIITAETRNDSAPPGTSESPPVMLMLDNQRLHAPFLFPKPDDVIINSPPLPPGEAMSVDLLEVDNLSPNATANHTSPPDPPTAPAPDEPDSLNTVDTHGNDDYLPFKPNRGRLLSHTSQPSFYPRILNRVLG